MPARLTALLLRHRHHRAAHSGIAVVWLLPCHAAFCLATCLPCLPACLPLPTLLSATPLLLLTQVGTALEQRIAQFPEELGFRFPVFEGRFFARADFPPVYGRDPGPLVVDEEVTPSAAKAAVKPAQQQKQ